MAPIFASAVVPVTAVADSYIPAPLTGPGQITDTPTRCPSERNDTRKLREKPTKPCFDAAYASSYGVPTRPDNDEIFTMWPSPRLIMYGTSKRERIIGASRFTDTMSVIFLTSMHS